MTWRLLMKTTIGIPRALLYYEFYPLWKTFFEEIGVEVKVSPKTNKAILNQGTALTVDDACIPVKVYHGHIQNLKDQVDYLFVPRIMGVYDKEFICPKFCGLPEMINCSIKDMPTLIKNKIHLDKKNSLKKSLFEIGSLITNDKKVLEKAYQDAIFNYQKEKNKTHLINPRKNIMLLGHPYILYDDFLNMNIKKKLKDKGYQYLTPDMFDEAIMNHYANKYHGKIFWLFFRQMIGACFYLLEHQIVDGVIYLSSFGCGIDSVVAETVERNIRRYSNIPFMLLTIDEHSGEAGFNTRIEAFTDMLEWRSRNENDISPYGDNVHPRQDDIG